MSWDVRSLPMPTSARKGEGRQTAGNHVYRIAVDGAAMTDLPIPLSPFITCMRNPYLEKADMDVLVPAQKPKRVLIAGGGVAGLEAACILKQRGHQPVVYEASNELGGQFVIAGKARGRWK